MGRFPLRLLRRHVRLCASIAVGSAVCWVAPGAWPGVGRVLLGWDIGVWLFLALTWLQMTRLPVETMRSIYEEDEGTAWGISLLTTVAALLSLVAIIAMLGSLKQVSEHERNLRLMLAVVTVVGSWLLVPTVFTLHYADMFYSSRQDERPLEFPGTEVPAFWDFVYFSFTIAVACQTADVATRNAWMRRAVTGQALVSFIFNVSILGFAINVSAGLVGQS